MGDEYMSDPDAKNVKGFVRGLTLLSNYMDKGLAQPFFCGAEHDCFHVYVGADKLPEDSEDGRILRSLGFHVEDGGWAYFT